jgi:hypothetical protein
MISALSSVGAKSPGNVRVRFVSPRHDSLGRRARGAISDPLVDPPSLTTVAPKWEPGDTIPLGKRTLRVIGVRNIDTDEPTVLVVEDTSG